MSDKPKFPRAVAIDAVKEILPFFGPVCVRLVVAGSLRRKKQLVGDIEILFIPHTKSERDGLFGEKHVSLCDEVIDRLESKGILEKRRNVLGRTMFGEANKYMRHVRTGIPVDLFATSEVAWFNYLCCRTGPAESNTRIATLAQQKGWKWHPTAYGFENLNTGEKFVVKSEADVFEFVGLPFLPPEKRGV